MGGKVEHRRQTSYLENQPILHPLSQGIVDGLVKLQQHF